MVVIKTVLKIMVLYFCQASGCVSKGSMSCSLDWLKYHNSKQPIQVQLDSWKSLVTPNLHKTCRKNVKKLEKKQLPHVAEMLLMYMTGCGGNSKSTIILMIYQSIRSVFIYMSVCEIIRVHERIKLEFLNRGTSV